jgi:hypothetical protein
LRSATCGDARDARACQAACWGLGAEVCDLCMIICPLNDRRGLLRVPLRWRNLLCPHCASSASFLASSIVPSIPTGFRERLLSPLGDAWEHWRRSRHGRLRQEAQLVDEAMPPYGSFTVGKPCVTTVRTGRGRVTVCARNSPDNWQLSAEMSLVNRHGSERECI